LGIAKRLASAAESAQALPSDTGNQQTLNDALKELAQEGGVSARHQRYRNNQRRLVAGMRALGFRPLLDDSLHSPI
ncbi:hypothetical protein OFN53_43300, partial [Escherichia coli]|nr:hypothetical protein [Escherichia coli]